MYLGAGDTQRHFLLVSLGRATHDAREVSGPGSALEADEDVLFHSFARERTAVVCWWQERLLPEAGAPG